MPAKQGEVLPIEHRTLRVILRHSPFAQAITLLFGLLAVIALYDHVPAYRLLAWFGLLVMVMALRLWSISRQSRWARDDSGSALVRRQFANGLLFSGLVWACLPWIANTTATGPVFFVAVLMIGLIASATAALALNPQFFLVFTLPSLVSLLTYLLVQAVEMAGLVALTLLLFYVMMYKGTRLVGDEVRNYLRLRLDADQQRKGVERQAAELAIANAANLRRREMLEGLLRIATLAEVDALRKLDRLLEFGCNTLGLRAGVVAEIRNDERRVFARHDPGNRDAVDVVALSDSVCSLTMMSEEPFHFANAIEARNQLSPNYVGETAGAYIGTRIHTSEGVFGTVSFHDTIARSAPFTETERDFVRLLAGWIGAELSEYFVQRRLRIKEQQLSTLADAMPCGMASLNARGEFQYANRLFESTFNAKGAPLLGREVEAFLSSGTEKMRPYLDGALAGEAQEFEYRIPGSDNDNERVYRINLVPNEDEEGKQSGCFVLALDITEDKALQSELELKASLDPLTRIYNRKYLEDALAKILADRRRRKPVYVALLDLDGFKQINDTAGHDAGDAILCEVAAALREGLRKHDLLARYGGDEFVVLLYCVDEVDLLDTCQKMLSAISERTYRYGEREFTVGMSIGATQVRRGEPMPQLLVRADSAMYLAKRRGRNRIEIVAPDDTPVKIRNRSA